MDLRFVDGNPDDERIAVIVALAIGAYLTEEADEIVEPAARARQWVAAARLEARGIQVSPASLERGWRAHG